MDGMPLTYSEINSVLKMPKLRILLDDLVKKGYLTFEHPKDLFKEEDLLGNKRIIRRTNHKIEKGYNIVSGKLSFEFSHILDPNGVAPTLVATDVSKLAVPDGQGLRRLSLNEGIKLFGLPATFRSEER